MPLGLNRTGDFRNGSPITLPKEFGTPIVEPVEFGNPVTLPLAVGNPVTWQTPDPAHFGNLIGSAITSGLLLEDGVSFFELEDGTGVILLET